VVELVIVFVSVRQLLSSFPSFLRGVSSFLVAPRCRPWPWPPAAKGVPS
jgi:hypothetical protein